jgi:hypothetical protein
LEEATLLFLYILRWPKKLSIAANPPIRADTGTMTSNKSKRADSSRKNIAAMTLTSVIQCDFTTDLSSTGQEPLANPQSSSVSSLVSLMPYPGDSHADQGESCESLPVFGSGVSLSCSHNIERQL